MKSLTFTDPAQFLDYTVNDLGLQTYNVDNEERYRWGVFERQCHDCAHTWVAVAAVGTCGIECPKCHELELEYLWRADDD
jgi:hypothetical protein